MEYDLTQDAITKKPSFYCSRGLKEIVTLEEAKEITKEYFTKYYDFNSKLKKYIYNVDKCKDILTLQYYIECAAVKGLTIKNKINLSKLYKNQKNK